MVAPMRRLAVLTAVAAALSAPGAGAESPRRVVIAGRASAEGVRVTSRATGFLVEEVADLAAPVAQALVDPQDSTSFASLPYPGANGVALPGVIAAVGGPTLPAYPFYASASTSAPEQKVADPSGQYRLDATAAPGSAAGEATVNASGFELRTTAVVAAKVNETTSLAETVVHGLALGSGSLRIASLHSSSETVYPQDGSPPKTVTNLVIEGATAGPLSFAYGPEGLTVARQGVPVPAADALVALNDALAPAGVTIGFTRSEEVTGGRTSEALVVKQAGDTVNGSRSSTEYRIGATTSAVMLGDPLGAPATGAEIPPLLAPADSTAVPAPDVATGSPAGAGAAPPTALPPDGGSVPNLPSGTTGGAGRSFSESAAGGATATPPGPGPATAAPGAAFPLIPQRISATRPLAGLVIGAAAAMVALMVLWMRRGALTP
jgi:hypothetical protein